MSSTGSFRTMSFTKGDAFAQRLAAGPTLAHAAEVIVRGYLEGGIDEADRVTAEQPADCSQTETCSAREASSTRDRARRRSRAASLRPPSLR